MYYMFDSKFKRLGTLDTPKSAIWTEHYYECGNISISAVNTPHNIRMLATDNRVWQKGKKTSMIIENVKTTSQMITASGSTAIARLENRVVPSTVRVTNAELGMRQIVADNMRGLENLRLDDIQGYTETLEGQHTGGEAIETLYKICKGVGFGQYLRFAADGDTYCIYKGNESATVFRDDTGHLKDLETGEDISMYKNVAYVAGSGEGPDRTIIIVGDATGDDRREMWVDARDIQRTAFATQGAYENALRQRGVERLQERLYRMSFEAKMDSTLIGKQFNVGDIITCTSKQCNVTIKTRIMGYREEWENNRVILFVMLGEPKLTIFDEMEIRYGT